MSYVNGSLKVVADRGDSKGASSFPDTPRARGALLRRKNSIVLTTARAIAPPTLMHTITATGRVLLSELGGIGLGVVVG